MQLNLSFFSKRRKIGEFTPTVVINELITDTAEITEHPIESGSVITDHVIHKPVTVSMEVYFSESIFDGISAPAPAEIYAQILALKNSNEPFTLVLGKRELPNMLFTGIRNITDVDTEYVLSLSLEFQQVIFASLQEVQISTPQGQQAKTQQTGKKQAGSPENSATEQGVKEAAKKNSALYDLIGV